MSSACPWPGLSRGPWSDWTASEPQAPGSGAPGGGGDKGGACGGVGTRVGHVKGWG